jgi:ACS family allantoate permease-like MFS transporter
MIILGSVTIVFGVFCFFLLVDSPTSKFLRLTPEQEQVVKLRTIDNATVITNEIKYHQMIEALKEPRFYCFIFASLLFNLQNGALSTFSSIITAGFGFSVRIEREKHLLNHKLTLLNRT